MANVEGAGELDRPEWKQRYEPLDTFPVPQYTG